MCSGQLSLLPLTGQEMSSLRATGWWPSVADWGGGVYVCLDMITMSTDRWDGERQLDQWIRQRLAEWRELDNGHTDAVLLDVRKVSVRLRAGRHLLDHLRRRSLRQPAGSDCRHLEAREDAAASGDDDIRRFVGRVRPRSAALGDVDQRAAQSQSGVDVWIARLSHVRRVENADRRLLDSDTDDYFRW